MISNNRHTHLQFAQVNAQTQNCKRVWLANTENQSERKKASREHCINVMRPKVLNLNEMNINKHIGKPKMKGNLYIIPIFGIFDGKINYV